MSDAIHKYFPIIQSHYPNVLLKEVKYFDDGHDHHIFLINNGIAFRFSRGEEFGKKDRIENKFLQDFANQSPIKIQVFASYFDKKLGITYQVYQFIQGERFSVDLAKKFSEQESLLIAKKIGNFLKILHAYPIEKARIMRMDELDPRGYYEFFEEIWLENRKIIYPLLTKKEQEWCDRIFTNYMDTKDQSFIPLVTHNDMLPEHIIVNEEKHTLAGIIDFALRIADPARDFMFLHCYGDYFLETVFSEYGVIDKTFKKRREFYGGNFYVMYLYNAVTSIEKNIDTIEKHKQALSRYIADYPLIK